MNRSILACTFLTCCLAACGPSEQLDDEAVDVEIGEQSSALQLGGVVSFRNNKSGRCIGVDGASTANGALLKQFTCENAPNQRWRVSQRGVNTIFVNVKSGKCMGVDRASTSPGANIGQYNCGNFAPNQTWQFRTDDLNALHFFNTKSRLCVGVDGGSTANGAQLKQFACNLTAPNQEWRIIAR